MSISVRSASRLPCGQGVKLGVSSRGWASLRSDPASKCVFVDDDFELITFDFVTEPSTR